MIKEVSYAIHFLTSQELCGIRVRRSTHEWIEGLFAAHMFRRVCPTAMMADRMDEWAWYVYAETDSPRLDFKGIIEIEVCDGSWPAPSGNGTMVCEHGYSVPHDIRDTQVSKNSEV
jgi:hypothetical protein